MGTHVRQVCEAPHGGWTALAALLPHLERAHERRGGMLCNVEHGPAMINLAEAEFQAISRHQRYEGTKGTSWGGATACVHLVAVIIGYSGCSIHAVQG